MIEPRPLTQTEKRQQVLLHHHYSELNGRQAARLIIRALRIAEALYSHGKAVELAHDEAFLRSCAKRYLVSPDHYELVIRLVQARYSA